MANVGIYSFEEYIHLVKSFHGSVAPGIIIGGFMVQLAKSRMPENVLCDVLCETPACLPDAVQLLTPCTIGNGWLKIVDLGRYAVTFYDKYTGEGIRVFLDAAKLDGRQEIKNWYLKLKPKKEQDLELLLDQIKEAGFQIYGSQSVAIQPEFMEKRSKGKTIAICPCCGEAYPGKDGDLCKGCSGSAPYRSREVSMQESGPGLTAVPLDEAVGMTGLHDMTRIVPFETKGPAFRHNQVIRAEDVDMLRSMGREHVYVKEMAAPDENWVHEDDAALAFARAMAGPGVAASEKPSEGKVTFRAERAGLLTVDAERLFAFNLIPDVMCSSRRNGTLLSKDGAIGATRAIPLYLSKGNFDRAMQVLAGNPLFRVLPLRKAVTGILVTGTEVAKGLVPDRFEPLVRSKLERLGCESFYSRIVPDDRKAIAEGAAELIGMGIDLLVTTGGLSVDPDDVTRQGLIDAGADDLLYGAPILPGAMTLVGRIGTVQLVGVPAGALYFETTSFDILVPRLLAGLEITRQDLAGLGHGGYCLNCKTCVFPLCHFGK
ncbi:MAG: FmdE family protein [Syntrophales bacterium]|nr:FmdE family protein [Syntrophales bacterium]